jgi:hypothetical protein
MLGDENIDPVKTDTTPIEIPNGLADDLVKYREEALKTGVRVDLVSDGEMLTVAMGLIFSNPLTKLHYALVLAALILDRQQAEES